MNPGPTEEVGQTARGFIDALKDQPLSLALVVMNLTLLGFLYYTQIEISGERRHETDLLYENRKFVGDLLARCTLTPEQHK